MNKQENKFINELLTLNSRLESGEEVSAVKLAKIIKRLTEMEIEVGGPYSFAPNKNEAADLGLNLAIACFLIQQKVHLPKLDAFLESRLATTPPFESVLSDETIHELIDIYRAIEDSDDEDSTKEPITYDTNEQEMMEMIRGKFDERFSDFSAEVRERAKNAIEKTIRGNRDKQMALMALYTKQALGKSGKNITDEQLAEMGLANIFFWTAFIIYDDFWDEDEAADPKLLPVANVFARHYTDYFLRLISDQPDFRKFFHTLMDNLDAANAWETEHCRTRVVDTAFYIPNTLPEYGDYENKYRPASGHVLGPLALLASCGYSPNTSEAEHFITYFRHYLIAMQLNDDAHDWEEDLARGHLSTVVVLLLADLKEAGWEKPTIDLSGDLPKLKKIFWFKTLPKYVQATLAHTALSHEALAQMSAIENPAPLERLITVTEAVAHSAEKEFSDSQAIIGEYRA